MPAPQARTASAGPKKRRATSGLRYTAAIAHPAAWPMHQAVLASAPPITSMTSARLFKCSSSPPRVRGSRSRNSLAWCNDATMSGGRARATSIRSAEERSTSTRPCARLTASAAWTARVIGRAGPRPLALTLLISCQKPFLPKAILAKSHEPQSCVLVHRCAEVSPWVGLDDTTARCGGGSLQMQLKNVISTDLPAHHVAPPQMPLAFADPQGAKAAL